MLHINLDTISILVLVSSVLVSLATLLLARMHFVRVKRVWSRQTTEFVKKLGRKPATERLLELHRLAPSGSIDWRIADEALQVDDVYRAAAIDSVLAEIALELEASALWPRAAMRIAVASGVLLMAISIVLQRHVVVPISVLALGLGSAIGCMTLDRQARAIAVEVRRNVDALVDVLGVRVPLEARDIRMKHSNTQRRERRSRRR